MTVTSTRISPFLNVHTVDIANGATTSDTLFLEDSAIVGVILPVAHTNATLALHGSFDNTNFFPVKQADGTAVAITTANVTGVYKLPPGVTDGIPYARLVSSGNEGATRNFQVLTVNYKAQ